jgi:hypothetical protein
VSTAGKNEKLQHGYKSAAAKLKIYCKPGKPVFHLKPPLSKNGSNTTGDLKKNKETLKYYSFDKISNFS